MKIIILLLVIELSLTYDRSAAIKYARTYCQTYHIPEFEQTSASFVSQCMIAGGMDFSSCSVNWRDDHGGLPRVRDLKSCLLQKGWKYSSTRPASFKAGYPIFSTQYDQAMLATGISGNRVIFASPNVCDRTISSSIEYYYEK